ncbi:MAG: COG1361 S-layer family protein [Halobacteriota archaeon]
MFKMTDSRYTLPVVVSLAVLLLFTAPVQASSTLPSNGDFTAANAELPEFFNFDENYYTVFGGPDVTATLLGDNEFERGDTVTLRLDLMNKGLITGFRSEKDDFNLDALEQKIQSTEMSYESQRTTAIGIVAVLTPLDPAVKVKSGSQEAGTLVSGQKTDSPVSFNIEISNNAEKGSYPMRLDLYYGYQKNVQINGDNETDLGITNMEVGLWYDVGTQNTTFDIFVKDEARFEVTNVSGELYPDSEGLMYVTFENVGDLPAKDATVRISAADPFSTTDDQAFLGTLDAGESTVAVFRLKVDDLAVPKAYALNSEIKYEDTDGHDRISDTVKIKTEVLPASANERDSGISGIIIGAVIIIAIAGGAYYIYRGRGQKNNGE